MFPYICGVCGKHSCRCEKKQNIKNIELLPEYRSSSYEVRICEKCGQEGAEEHHWAPRYIFSEECEDWPKDYLCQKCHSEWHMKILSENTRAILIQHKNKLLNSPCTEKASHLVDLIDEFLSLTNEVEKSDEKSEFPFAWTWFEHQTI